MRILVVDDEITWCDTIKYIFESLEHEVDTAMDITKGLKKLQETKFDVLILDKNVPTEADGFKMLSKIARLKSEDRHADKFRYLQVVMLTGYETIESTKKAMKLRILDYVVKKEDYKAQLLEDIKKVSLIKKMSLFSLPEEILDSFLEITQLQEYFDNLASGITSKDRLTYGLFTIHILFLVQQVEKLHLLLSSSGILKEIPDFCEVSERELKDFPEISAEILRNGSPEDLECFYDFVRDIFKKRNGLIPENITKIDQWYLIHNLLSHLDVIIDEINKESFVMKLRNYLSDKRKEYNLQFADFIEENYAGWVKGAINKEEACRKAVLSPEIIDECIVPLLDRPTYFIIFDGMRLDQWIVVREIIKEDLLSYEIKEDLYLSILPTATTYSRNSLLSGLFPIEIADQYNKGYLKTNAYEKSLLLACKLLKDIPLSYLHRAGENLERLSSLIRDKRPRLKVLIFNFVDDLGHLMNKIGATEYDFRKHIQASFKNSVLQKTLLKIVKTGANIIITTDHGTKMVLEDVKLGDYFSIESKHSRYAVVDKKVKGKKQATVTVLTPSDFGLPDDGYHNYVFAKGDVRFLGKAKAEESEFVHGGISMEEMIVPIAILKQGS